jgi:hypothetical protein
VSDNQPAADAEIKISGPEQKEAKTDSSGSFTIRSIKCGVYSVNVSKKGFPPMNNLVVIGSDQSASLEIGLEPRRIYAAVYYDVQSAFFAAAKTWIDERKEEFGEFRVYADFQFEAFRTEGDFTSKWQQLKTLSEKPGHLVQECHVFSHATFEGGKERGLEFWPNKKSRTGTLTSIEIRRLARLNWSPNGRIVLHGCNTGKKMEGEDWSVADAFADSQKIEAVGQNGFAYFSLSQTEYVEIPASTKPDQKIYLWAYRRRRNLIFGNFPDSTRIDGRETDFGDNQ